MISDVHTVEVFMYPIKIRFRLIYSTSGLGAIGLPTRRLLSFLVNALTFIKNETDIHTREKS